MPGAWAARRGCREAGGAGVAAGQHQGRGGAGRGGEHLHRRPGPGRRPVRLRGCAASAHPPPAGTAQVQPPGSHSWWWRRPMPHGRPRVGATPGALSRGGAVPGPGLATCRIDGATAVESRQDVVNAFNSADSLLRVRASLHRSPTSLRSAPSIGAWADICSPRKKNTSPHICGGAGRPGLQLPRFLDQAR